MYSEEQPRRRRRPALSCLACRRRKIKCDRANPCARCVFTSTRCTYRVVGSETASASQAHTQKDAEDPATSSPRASPLPLARVIDEEISATGHEEHAPAPRVYATASVAPQAEWSVVASRNDALGSIRPQETTSDFRDLGQRVRKLEELSASNPIHGLAETGRHILARQAGLRDSAEISLKKTRLLRWSDWMGTAPEFQYVYNCFEVAMGGGEGTSFQSEETKALFVEVNDLYQKCKRVAKNLKVNRPSRSLSSPRPSLEPPPRDIADAMAAVYFRYFEPAHRILHEPSFWAEYLKLWEAPENVTTGQRLKFLLVIGIGSSLHGDAGPDSELRGKVQQWIYTAQAWLSGPLEKDRLDVHGLQIHCLATLARQIFSIGGDLVWMSMGSLIHRAMQIGLHRDPRHLPITSLLQAEVRRRLWYTILEFLVQSSLDSAMPPRISFEDFDTEAPSNNNDDEIDESTTVLQPHPRSVHTSTAIQLLLIDSLQSRLRIVQLLNELHSELAYPDVLALSPEITNACRACSKFATVNAGAGVTVFHRNYCDYLVRRFLIPLHCPFASEGRRNPLFHYSQTVALEAALTFISPVPDESFSRLMATGGGTFREGFRYAAATVSHELLVQAQVQRDDGTFLSSTRRLEFLKQALHDVAAWSWERIRQGETNIKGPMFMNIVLAVADSPHKDTLCEFTMAKNARDSLVLCHETLETRARAAPLPSANDGSIASSNLDGDQDFGLEFSLDFFFPNGSAW
ncbi:hypothetical protein F4678DRAFT_437701 [Xylaria arbuscula]|nr:hypothetical protein F4678DRAFT_437701 [Xylaria arbuscula]